MKKGYLTLMVGVAALALMVTGLGTAYAQPTIAPLTIPKYTTPLLIPPVMPKAGTVKLTGGKNADYYEISVRQFAQQILPAGLPTTTV